MTRLGLQTAIVSSDRLYGTCYDVEAGAEAELWHPSKDPSNMLCYFDAGTPTHARCPVVPSTPPELAAQDQYIRRICPCFNVSAVQRWPGVELECSVGDQLVYPAVTERADQSP